MTPRASALTVWFLIEHLSSRKPRRFIGSGRGSIPFNLCDKGTATVRQLRMPVKTITCKLLVDADKAAALDASFDAFNAACNSLSSVAFKKKHFRPVPLHREAYYATRAAFDLPAQLTVRAI